MIVNKRADEMWKYISDNVDFEDKYVFDIGAGYCDLAIHAAEAGAYKVTALEDKRIDYTEALAKTDHYENIRLLNMDAELFLDKASKALQFDIAICTSVIPYLMRPWEMVKWMSEHARHSIIECQYINDGPPGQTLKIEGDARMEAHLRMNPAWDSKANCRKIGETLIEIRPGTRSIWLCTNDEIRK
jgi:2-polyprenyl-3-methyl-5-hydroxy-6-metoxy-1,4-benzoquinol methylase